MAKVDDMRATPPSSRFTVTYFSDEDLLQEYAVAVLSPEIKSKFETSTIIEATYPEWHWMMQALRHENVSLYIFGSDIHWLRLVTGSGTDAKSESELEPEQ